MTWLVALGVPAAFSLIGWRVLNQIDDWLDYSRDQNAATPSREDLSPDERAD